MRFALNIEIKFNEAKKSALDAFKLFTTLSSLRIPNNRAIFKDRPDKCTKNCFKGVRQFEFISYSFNKT